MSGIGEKTPLLQQDNNKDITRERALSFYFEQKANKKGDSSYDAVTKSTTDKEEEVDLVPRGINSGEFSSRAVVVQVGDGKHVSSPMPEKGILYKMFTPKEHTSNAAANNATNIGTLLKQRKVPIKVEPKVFFSNERTFIAWLHVSTILAGGSIAIVAFADANPWSQMYGIVLLPVSIVFIGYAMWQYVKRSAMIRRHDPGPYEDLVGPTVLGIMLMLSIVVQFSIKLYSLVAQ